MNKILIVFILLSHVVYGQDYNTFKPSSLNRNSRINDSIVVQRPSQKRFISRDNVIWTTTNFALEPIEAEIFRSEVAECNAMIKRDSEALMNIWLYDFSLEKQTNELLNSKTGLPFYARLIRLVENWNIVGELIFTSGTEKVVELKLNGAMGEEFSRQFAHIWIKKAGVFKLSSKSYVINSTEKDHP